MSTPLIDARIYITELTDSVVDAEVERRTKLGVKVDRSQVMRDVLHEWAFQKMLDAVSLCNKLESKGLVRNTKE